MPSENSLTTPGELYFIRESDPLTNEISPYVKVGIIKENGGGENPHRQSGDRLTEHQTGNPRILYIDHVTMSPAVRFLENTLHHVYARFRVQGEWFKLTDESLQEIITESERLATELRSVQAELGSADAYKNVPSTDETVTPDAVVASWYQRWLRSEIQLEAIEPIRTRLAELAKAADAEGEDVTHVATVSTVTKTKFDLKKLKAEHPDIYAAFLIDQEKLVGPFRMNRDPLKALSLAEVEPALEALITALSAAAERVSAGEIPLASLKEFQVTLEPYEARAEWDKTLAEGVIKAVSGPTQGVDGVCTWNRRNEVKQKFDEQAFGAAHPELKAALTVATTETRATPAKYNRPGLEADGSED